MKIFGSTDFTNGCLPFGIAQGRWEKGEVYDTHCHDFIELVYVISGDSIHHVDNQSIRVSKGQILMIGYNQTHSFEATEKMDYCNFFIKPEYISEHLVDARTVYDVFSFFILDKYFHDEHQRPPVVTFSGAEKAKIDTLVKNMILEEEQKQPGYELGLDGYMKLIFSRIIRTLRQSEQHVAAGAITAQLLEYIDSNYTENLTLGTLAEKCFYNPAYLGRLFKSTFNKSLREYISEKRVAYAKELLVESSETIEAVSVKVGYDDKKRFYEVFKEKTGSTPGEYRKNKKNAEP